jgi:DNA-directed RNA polymerase subunit RPC12/RpoP
MITHCSICGRPLSEVDVVLAERDARYQCHHCWNRVRQAAAMPVVQFRGKGKLRVPRPMAKRREKTPYRKAA